MHDKLIHVMADTANGIQVIDAADQPKVNWLAFDDFFEQLPTLQDDELLFCSVNVQQLEQLKNDYGVSK